MHINSYSYNLSGTNFGALNAFPKASFYDGYYFTDFKGDANINYTLTITGGSFIEEAEENIISDNDMLFWLDSSDKSTISYDLTGGIFSIRDKSGNLDDYGEIKVFLRDLTSSDVLTAYWPVYSNGKFASGGEIETYFDKVSSVIKECIKFNQNSLLGCSGFYLDFDTGPLTIFYVWKDNNTVSRSIPFCIKTKTNSITSEFVAYTNNFNSDTLEPAIAWGTRGTGSLDPNERPIGFRVTPLSSTELFNNPNITFYNSASGGTYDIYNLNIDNTILYPDGPYFHSYYYNTPFSTIGYLDDGNFNDFYFGEIMVFKKSLNEAQRNNIFNYLANKWFLYDTTRDNTIFNKSLSGGLFTNDYYEDVVLKESFFSIPIQSCTTLLSIVLSSFDETVSNISKIVCDYNTELFKLETPLNIDTKSADLIKNTKKIDILLNPEGVLHRNTYNIKLSVYKFDTTVNKITLSGEIIKCGIHDIYYDNYLLDSQISSDSNNLILINESKKNKQLYLNNIDIGTSMAVMSGGNDKELENIEFIQSQEITLTLADLLGIVPESTVTYKRPIISPVTNPNINPVSPTRD